METSTIANSQAQRTACEAFVQSFENKNSTMLQQQNYADCVQLLHPTEFSGPSLAFMKILIFVAFIGLFVGAYVGRKSVDSWLGVLGNMMAGSFASAIVYCFFVALLLGMKWALGL